MIFQPSPVELADLEWLFCQSEGDIKLLKSLLAAAIEKMQFKPIVRNVPFRYSETDEKGRTVWHGTVDVGLRCGPVEVKTPKGSGGSRTSGVNGKGMALGGSANELDRRALAAAGRERRIRAGLAGADAGAPYANPPWRCAAVPSQVLRLRFREPLAACSAHGPSGRKGCRVPFGLAGGRARRAETRAPLRDEVRLTPLRGAGSLAHLTDAARAAFACSRTRLDIEGWLDRLGGAVCARQASPGELAVAREIRREAESLELQALRAYRAASVRVPERVRRAARARAAEREAA